MGLGVWCTVGVVNWECVCGQQYRPAVCGEFSVYLSPLLLHTVSHVYLAHSSDNILILLFSTILLPPPSSSFSPPLLLPLPRNPVHTLRPTFDSIHDYLDSPEDSLLHWRPEDVIPDKQAHVLGAPLLEANNLYFDLQRTYQKPSDGMSRGSSNT